MLRRIFFVVSVIVVSVLLTGSIYGVHMYYKVTRDMPKISGIRDYLPKAVTTLTANDGTILAEYYDQKRYPVSFQDIPLIVRNAFLAAEDGNFYSHKGIDFTSILRAIYVNFKSSKAKQGASTITQQIVKNLLLNRDKTYERKIKEAILSYQIESALTKDQILEVYLNEIYLGLDAYGISAAAKAHFHKNLNDINIAEAAFLAALPKKPAELSDPKNREGAIIRQQYVISQMLKHNMITLEQAEEARNFKLVTYPRNEANVFHAPYFSGFAYRELENIVKQINPNFNPVIPGGFVVKTSLDLRADKFATRALQKGLRDIDKRKGYRGPLGNINDTEQLKQKPNMNYKLSKDELLKLVSLKIDNFEPGVLYPAIVKEKLKKDETLKIEVGGSEQIISLKGLGWAKKFITRKTKIIPGEDMYTATSITPYQFLRIGDVIEVSLINEEVNLEQVLEEDPESDGSVANDNLSNTVEKIESGFKFKLDQTPEVEGALVVLNHQTGEVKTVIGGYSFKRNVFNRAVQAELQPGSSFKPFVYLSALEKLNFTPSTIVPDSPISMVAGNGKLWSPGNFDGKFLGPITLRTALQKSRNVVSVYLLNKVGVDKVIDVARKLGITTPIPRNMSISLGTPEVHLIEMVRAYGAIGAGGWLADQLVITEIKDRTGKIIYQGESKQKNVIKAEDAFVLTNMMKGVIERGTATVLKKLNRPIGGKTGTTNGHNDTWFIGFTSKYAFGVWVGYDQKAALGKEETGGKAAAPIILNFLENYLKGEKIEDFDIPAGVVPVPVDVNSGDPVAESSFIEYFKLGTEPSSYGSEYKTDELLFTGDEF